MNERKRISREVIGNIVDFAAGVFYGSLGSFLFILAWAIAFLVGFRTGSVLEKIYGLTRKRKVACITIGIFAGQLPMWLAYSTIFERNLLWLVLGPSITALSFLGGVLSHMVTSYFRRRKNSLPPSDTGSAAMPHKRNPTGKEQNDGLKYVAKATS
ncbi:MAG: hypothetical protein AAB490_01520 [Patescibacteria group bacterium]